MTRMRRQAQRAQGNSQVSPSVVADASPARRRLAKMVAGVAATQSELTDFDAEAVRQPNLDSQATVILLSSLLSEGIRHFIMPEYAFREEKRFEARKQ